MKVRITRIYRVQKVLRTILESLKGIILRISDLNPDFLPTIFYCAIKHLQKIMEQNIKISSNLETSAFMSIPQN